MTVITFYYRRVDDPDGNISRLLQELGKELDFTPVDICLDDDPDLMDRLQEGGSSLQIGPYRLRFPFEEVDIRIAVRAYQESRASRLEDLPQTKNAAANNATRISGLERFSYWLSNNYVWFITAILVLFIGLPLLAPVLMKENHKTPAQVIYRVYSVLCHQLAFRSYFFYGEQAFYPRELAGIPNLLTYEAVTGKSAVDTTYARTFEGNDLLGYKVGICERDLAIYGSLIIAGLLFQLTGKKLKAIPWYWWVILAIIPIGLDGGSQLFSLGGNWPSWFPIRESTPLLRTITGALFGLVTAWYVYPMMEESMLDLRMNLARKLAIKKKLMLKEKSL